MGWNRYKLEIICNMSVISRKILMVVLIVMMCSFITIVLYYKITKADMFLFMMVVKMMKYVSNMKYSVEYISG